MYDVAHINPISTIKSSSHLNEFPLTKEKEKCMNSKTLVAAFFTILLHFFRFSFLLILLFCKGTLHTKSRWSNGQVSLISHNNVGGGTKTFANFGHFV